MKTFSALLVVAGLLGALAHDAAAQTVVVASPKAYRGEVWTWDPTLNTVTLRQGAEDVRIKVTPDQLVGLRGREIVTVVGVPAAPLELERVTVQGPPVRAVVTGPMDQTEITGTITAVHPDGRISLATSRGPLDVWVATPVGDRFQPGATVQIKSIVQTVTLVALDAGPAPQPAALVATEPGDYAVVTGRILALEPTGRITIESPRGPMSTWVADSGRYTVGQVVQVRTAVVAAR